MKDRNILKEENFDKKKSNINFDKLKSKYILKKIFNHCKKKIFLAIIKYNKKLR